MCEDGVAIAQNFVRCVFRNECTILAQKLSYLQRNQQNVMEWNAKKEVNKILLKKFHLKTWKIFQFLFKNYYKTSTKRKNTIFGQLKIPTKFCIKFFWSEFSFISQGTQINHFSFMIKVEEKRETWIAFINQFAMDFKFYVIL